MPDNVRPTDSRYICVSLLQNQDPMARSMRSRTIHNVIKTKVTSMHGPLSKNDAVCARSGSSDKGVLKN